MNGRGGWAQKVLESKTERPHLHITVLLKAILLIYLYFEDYICIQIGQTMTTFKYT